MKRISLLFAASLCFAQPPEDFGQLTANLPFQMAAPQLPEIPNRTCLITSHGAAGDGQTLNTAAFAKAIETCAKSGGGRVIVPRGLWLTGPIQLQSNIDLHLESGAVLLFSRRLEDYAVTDSSGSRRVVHPLTARNLENVAITGPGIVDGAGDAWRPVKKSKMTPGQWKALLASGGSLNKEADLWYPAKDAFQPGSLASMRPHMVQIENCRRVLLDGPTFQNSPNWNLHPLLSEDVVIRNVTVLNPWYSQNGDGLDIDACRRVVVYNSRFDVGDDAICLKSGAGPAARRRGRAAEEIVISRCTVYHGHGGVTIGSEMSGGIRNVFVDNCVFLGTDQGLRFKSTRGRGGVVENIYYRNISMKDIPTDAIGFTMSYGGQAPDEVEGPSAAPAAIPPVDEGTPRFRNIFFSNILCNGARRAIALTGLPEMPVENIRFDGVVISARQGFQAQFASNVKVANTRILPESGSVYSIADSTGITIDVPASGASSLTLIGTKTAGIQLTGAGAASARHSAVFERGAQPAALLQ